ncbi:LacI family transcriptional regulator [Xaviernesmea oryzae]|uniref:LacI family transcriptional regulator n=1 Tax=Xaviernesmea oryzae TaxID=464029 RepID=A0A1Q9AUU3_9HYPH|nr:LacI family DNA-binding transcriptional regulator [Xaviernesmea oryzae]OLP59203.1 LacI family transcriptional regulator [Xaviernesmea oryzae]SEK81940.1 LacI family transcriptional regulator [Xaviernesmea oryzae]
MSGRPTIADLARAAGVSVATVDRVLNGRHRVREDTARRVYDAARAIGYHAVGLLRQRVFEDLPHVRLGFLLQKPDQPFYQAVMREIEQATLAAPGVRAVPQIDFVPNSTPSVLSEKLKTMAARNQAIAMVAPDVPALAAVVEELSERGIPVFTLLSDFAVGARRGYIGLDNVKVGRTAAWMIAKAVRKPGKVAAFVGSHRFHGHELRELGFRSYIREHAPELEMLDTLVNLDTAEITHEATLNLAARHPDLVGLYVCGGGMEGAISALREDKLGGRIATVVNELTPDSRAALAEEVVTMAIATPVERLARDLVARMLGALDGSQSGASQIFLPFEIYTPENI